QHDLFSAGSGAAAAASAGPGQQPPTFNQPTADHGRNGSRRDARSDDRGDLDGATEPSGRSERKLPHLNPKYVFANFVVGPNNHLANAAAQAVAESVGQTYNPLFLYGESGLGKTHLMHAVGHAVGERHPLLFVEYATTETFTNNLVDAIQG